MVLKDTEGKYYKRGDFWSKKKLSGLNKTKEETQTKTGFYCCTWNVP